MPFPGRPLQARYYGPYTVDKKLSDVNYTVNTPGRRKQKQLCHINMLKKYIDRDSSVISSVNLVNTVPLEQNQMDSEDMNFVKSDPASSKLKNSDILKDLDQKLSHLSSDKKLELKQLILEYEHLFPDIPSKTDKIYHDVELIDGSKPVKQHPYRMNPVKVSNGAKIRNRYNQVPHLTQDTNGKVTNSQKTPQTRAKRSALSQQVTTKHI